MSINVAVTQSTITATATDTGASVSVAETPITVSVSAQTTITASNVTILDTGTYYTGTEVETALQEVGASIAGLGSPVAADVTIADGGSYYTGGNVELALQEIGAGTTLDGRYVEITGDTMTGDLLINSPNSAIALVVEDSGTKDDVLVVDTGNGRVGVGTPAPSNTLHVATTDTVVMKMERLSSAFNASCEFKNTAGSLFFGIGTGAHYYIATASDMANNALMILENTGNVGIGLTSPGAKLHIKGSADDQQLIIQANATQTANILEVQDSSANVLAGVDERGVLFCDGGTAATNTFIGGNTGSLASTGANNAAMGESSSVSLIGGTANMAFGAWSLNAATEGDNNVAIGYAALTSITDGHRNVAIGRDAIRDPSDTSIVNNVAIGFSAGYNCDSRNIFIGAYAGYRQTSSDKFIIDNLQRADIATEVSNSILYGVMAAAPANQTLRVNAKIGAGLTPTANMGGVSIEDGLLTLKETTTPTADADYGKIYTKSDNELYFQDGAGVEHTVDVDAAGGGDVATDSIWDAKGDLAVGTGADTAAKLTVGTNTHVLTANSAEATGLEWVAPGAPGAHKDTHDPEDGADALDTANAAEISVVVAAGTGTSHSFARADHIHAINHAITDNHLLTVDQADAASGEYAKFTANGIESKSVAEVLSDLSVTSGADVTGDNPPQAHKDTHDPSGTDPLDTANAASIAGVQAVGEGSAESFARSDHVHGIAHSIADNALVTVDSADAASGEYAKLTASGIESKTVAELLTDVNLTQALINRVRGTVSDPTNYYDQRAIIPLFRSDAAITITRIHIHGPDATPTAEMALDLKFADDLFDGVLANATVIDVCDTTSGVVTITAGFDDATVPDGKYIYWSLDAAPHADWTDFWFEIYYTYD